MDVEFLELADPRWPALLSRVRHDIDHLPAALTAYDAFRGVSSQLLMVEDAEGTTPQWRRQAIGELLDFLQLRGVVTLFLRLHPLLDSAEADLARFGAIVDHGPTFDIPLDRPLEEIRGGMRMNHRRGIRSFHANGFSCEPDTEWRYLDEFYHLYSLEFFEQLRDGLGDIAELLYVGANPQYQQQVPQIGLYDRELEWAHGQGLHDYFLDEGAHESLRHFKAGITKVQPIASSARIVVDPVEYGRLCALWEREHERVVGRTDGFFPPYLQPAESSMDEPARA